MATPGHHLPLLLLVLATLAAAAFAVAPVPGPAALGGGGPLLGGWNPIPDVGDKHIQELGGWALGQAKYQKLAANALRFRRVVRGEEQVVSGMRYRLYVDAADRAGRSVTYVAVIYEQVWTNTRKLASFTLASRAH
ncbi:cysteine proteinase inhibitor 8 [Sorghum bicolor]|jgi:cystatin-C|uniref:Cystatin domain-containing protein n=1 Tax=Sorghum bicolor TaxID=4558 RepID=C5WVG9_SORBI|nr:cysteine proteinase inhibitor 8 [Sorghum bicolor]EER92059.1 hypothetical protein SORBI_3001G324800 [Sorghum bicolor]|eukprot:XP_002465061.1 cysteine proteinase inhibitor 8 [Sorghum bicolor]